MKIFIKNMVCPCCKIVLKSEMEKLNIQPIAIDANEIEIDSEVSENQLLMLQQAIIPFGLEMMHDKKSRLIEKIKMVICDLVNSTSEELRINLSEYISNKIKYNYNYLNNIFKESQGLTIEKFYISKKIERVKEMLRYEDLSLSEIAYKMQYSSLAHLSKQFKKVTGVQPSYFKQFIYKPRQLTTAC